MRAAFLVSILMAVAGLALSGCIGDDAPKPAPTGEDKTADEALVTENTGSVTGQIVTNDLEVVAGAAVGLLSGGNEAARTGTDNQGKFTFNGIEPGSYRLQVAAPCCRVGIAEVVVEAGKVTLANFQLARLTAEDLQVPFVDSREWKSLITCSVAAGGVGLAACSLTEDTPLHDPNDGFLLEWNVSKGVRGIAVGMTWDPVGGVSGGEFELLVENSDCTGVDCSYRYAAPAGPPPLVAVVNDADITADDWKWTKVEDKRDLQFRVFATGETLIYQQPFTVYYDTYYWQGAPAEADPIPDQ